MRYYRDVSGIERIRTKESHRPKTWRGYEPIKREDSEDTRIRKDIYRIIMEMMRNSKNTIETEIYLRGLYPNYADFIPKVVNDIYKKYKKIEDKEIKNDGDER